MLTNQFCKRRSSSRACCHQIYRKLTNYFGTTNSTCYQMFEKSWRKRTSTPTPWPICCPQLTTANNPLTKSLLDFVAGHSIDYSVEILNSSCSYYNEKATLLSPFRYNKTALL